MREILIATSWNRPVHLVNGELVKNITLRLRSTQDLTLASTVQCLGHVVWFSRTTRVEGPAALMDVTTEKFILKCLVPTDPQNFMIEQYPYQNAAHRLPAPR